MRYGVRYDFRAPIVPRHRWFRKSCLIPFSTRWKLAPITFFTTQRSLHGRRVLLASLLLALGAGCSAITRPPVVRQTFLLDPPAPPAVAHSQPGALHVGIVNVAAPFRGKTFVYRVSDLRFDSDYYFEFFVPPATMLTEQTARALDRAKAFTRIAEPGAATEADWELNGFASALYADTREATKPAAELHITYYLTPTAGSQQTPVWSHEYRQHVPMRDATPAAYAEALNKAFGAIVADLAHDLASAQLTKP